MRHRAALGQGRPTARLLAVVLLAAVVSAFVGVAPARAASLTFTGALDVDGDVRDGHRFDVEQTGPISVSVDWDDPAADLNVFLKDPSGQIVQMATGADMPETLSHDAVVPGAYKVEIKAVAGAASYTAAVETPDPDPEPEPGPSGGASFSGTVDAQGAKRSAHEFAIDAAGTVDLQLEWSSGADLNLFLKDPAGDIVEMATGGDNPEVITHQAAGAGTYRAEVKAVSGSASYTLRVAGPGVGEPSGDSVASYVTAYGYRGPAGEYSYGLDWDATDDSIVVGDYWNYRVKRYTTDGDYVGQVSRWAQVDALGGSKAPYDVEADPQGNVWVADQGSSRIVKYDHDGNWLMTIGRGGGPESWMDYPVGCGGGSMNIPTHILVHPDTGDIYVSDPRCRDVYVFDSEGRYKHDFDFDLTAVGIYTPIPRGIDIDADGNIYVVEHNSRRVVVFDAAGNQLRYFDRQADMNDPRGLDIDRERGLVYVVGAYRSKLFQFRTDGSLRMVLEGSGGTRFDSLRWPTSDGDGNIYVSDTWAYRVWKFDVDGNPLPWAQAPQPPPDGGFNQVNGIGVDPHNDTLYAIDTFENRAQRFALTNPSTGEPWWCNSPSDCPAWEMQFGSREPASPTSAGFGNPRSLTFGDGSVWTDGDNAVTRFDRDGNWISRWGSQGTAPGQFKSGPMDIQVVPADDDPATDVGQVYTTDKGNCRLSIFDYDGNLQKYMGTCGTGAGQMQHPRQLDIDGSTVYVADAGRSNISVWNIDTSTQVRVMRPRVDDIPIVRPFGVRLDATGTWLYIGDSGNGRVIRVHPDGSGAELVTDGADTPAGSLKGPEYLEWDPDGRLLVSDNNQRIYAFEINE